MGGRIFLLGLGEVNKLFFGLGLGGQIFQLSLGGRIFLLGYELGGQINLLGLGWFRLGERIFLLSLGEVNKLFFGLGLGG